MAAEMGPVEINPEGVLAFLNSRAVTEELTAAATTITAAAMTYSGKFTGELEASMQWQTHEGTDGVQVTDLGSGARDDHTVAQAALNWYDHRDPAGIAVSPEYPRWEPHEGTKPGPTHPYEKALHELHIDFTINPEWVEWATHGGSKK